MTATSSIKDLVKKKILVDMIRSIQPEGKWKILVIDANSLAILNSVCRLNDVLDENVTLVEDISRKRQAFPQQEAIYFISPIESSIQAFINDFSIKGKPQYSKAHIFCTSAASDDLFAMVKTSSALPFVKNWKEINVDFIALEKQVFTFNMPENFVTNYTANPSQEAISEDMRAMAKKMLSVFSTLAESPIIRYYDPSNLKVNKSYQLATALQTELDNFIKEDPEFPSKDAEYRAEGKGTVIIVERNFDMVAPLLHEFTYQAMLNDLLVLKNGKYSFKIEAEEDQKAGMATIDENDDIWRLIRHWHFADAVEYISGTFEKFISNNKAAAAALGHNEGPQGIESLNNMKDTLSALPEFQEMKTKFSLHINICQECKTVFEQRNLNLLAGIEQNLATGETAEGKTVRNGMQDLVPVLYDKSVPNVDKIRLLMLYIICQDGINDNDRRKLLEYAKLSIEECQAITNLSLLGLRLVPLTTSLEKKQVADLRGPYTYRGKKGDKRRTTNDDMAYDLSRYVPLLKLVMEDEMSQTISQKYFPFTVEPPTNATLKRNKASNEIKVSSQPQVVNGVLMGTGQNPYSLRTLRASWASSPTKKKISGADDNGKKPENDKLELDPDALLLKEYRKNGPRLIVFVIGGMTYSEMRSCYEVMRDSRREVIIGSTHILKPQAFVETLKDLHKQDIKLGNAAKTNPLLSRNSIAEIVEAPSTLTSSNSVYSMNPEKEKKNFNLFRKKTATTAVKK